MLIWLNVFKRKAAGRQKFNGYTSVEILKQKEKLVSEQIEIMQYGRGIQKQFSVAKK